MRYFEEVIQEVIEGWKVWKDDIKIQTYDYDIQITPVKMEIEDDTLIITTNCQILRNKFDNILKLYNTTGSHHNKIS
jgi:hypothetical protein